MESAVKNEAVFTVACVPIPQRVILERHQIEQSGDRVASEGSLFANERDSLVEEIVDVGVSLVEDASVEGRERFEQHCFTAVFAGKPSPRGQELAQADLGDRENSLVVS